ncbi:Periplasmic protein TonB [uncultured Gammaproteobacteria bacterium]
MSPVVTETLLVVSDHILRQPSLASRRVLLGGVLVISLVLHLCAGALLLFDPSLSRDPDSVKDPIAVDLVPEPPKPESPNPEPPNPEPPQPEPPQPRASKPEPAKPEPRKPAAAGAMGKPQRPQLDPAPFGNKSSQGSAGVRAVDLTRDGDLLTSPGSGGAFRHGEPTAGSLSQSAQDFILAQIVKNWHFNYRDARGSGVNMTAEVSILQDGTLEGPMSKNAPLNPAVVIANYGAMVLRGETYRVEAVESFLKAVRLIPLPRVSR